MLKECQICGKEFAAKRSTAKYCSNACRCMAKRGVAYTGQIRRPELETRLDEAEILEVVTNAHHLASDMSRVAMFSPYPLSKKLNTVSSKISKALEKEGL